MFRNFHNAHGRRSSKHINYCCLYCFVIPLNRAPGSTQNQSDGKDRGQKGDQHEMTDSQLSGYESNGDSPPR